MKEKVILMQDLEPEGMMLRFIVNKWERGIIVMAVIVKQSKAKDRKAVTKIV